SLGFGYKIERTPMLLPDGGFVGVPTHTRTYGLTSALLPHTSLSLQYGTRSRSKSDTPREAMLAASANYLSPSGCWGLSGAWEKKFEERDWHGTYYLAL